MAGFDGDELRGFEFFDAAILVAHIDLAVSHETDMGMGAELFAENRPQVGVPGEAGRVDHPFDPNGAGAGYIDLDAADFAVLIGPDRRQNGIGCIHLCVFSYEQQNSSRAKSNRVTRR
jgi:hypothetical protein